MALKTLNDRPACTLIGLLTGRSLCLLSNPLYSPFHLLQSDCNRCSQYPLIPTVIQSACSPVSGYTSPNTIVRRQSLITVFGLLMSLLTGIMTRSAGRLPSLRLPPFCSPDAVVVCGRGGRWTYRSIVWPLRGKRHPSVQHAPLDTTSN